MVRRVAFVGGLILGSGICAVMLGAGLTYLLTGKLLAFQFSRAHGLKATLVDPQVWQDLVEHTEEGAGA